VKTELNITSKFMLQDVCKKCDYIHCFSYILGRYFCNRERCCHTCKWQYLSRRPSYSCIVLHESGPFKCGYLNHSICQSAFLLKCISKFVLRALPVTVRVQTSISLRMGSLIPSSIGRSVPCIVPAPRALSQCPAFSVTGRGWMRWSFE
jgi:hypothetical protein